MVLFITLSLKSVVLDMDAYQVATKLSKHDTSFQLEGFSSEKREK